MFWLRNKIKYFSISHSYLGAECRDSYLGAECRGLLIFTVFFIGDDIAWMRFDEKGVLHGINPEYGFFGVCPGTNMKTNPNAMLACRKNTIFTNVAETRDGGVFWEGLEEEVDPVCMLQ